MNENDLLEFLEIPLGMEPLAAGLSLAARRCAPCGPCVLFFQREENPGRWAVFDSGAARTAGPIPFEHAPPGNALEACLFEGKPVLVEASKSAGPDGEWMRLFPSANGSFLIPLSLSEGLPQAVLAFPCEGFHAFSSEQRAYLEALGQQTAWGVAFAFELGRTRAALERWSREGPRWKSALEALPFDFVVLDGERRIAMAGGRLAGLRTEDGGESPGRFPDDFPPLNVPSLAGRVTAAASGMRPDAPFLLRQSLFGSGPALGFVAPLEREPNGRHSVLALFAPVEELRNRLPKSPAVRSMERAAEAADEAVVLFDPQGTVLHFQAPPNLTPSQSPADFADLLSLADWAAGGDRARFEQWLKKAQSGEAEPIRLSLRGPEGVVYAETAVKKMPGVSAPEGEKETDAFAALIVKDISRSAAEAGALRDGVERLERELEREKSRDFWPAVFNRKAGDLALPFSLLEAWLGVWSSGKLGETPGAQGIALTHCLEASAKLGAAIRSFERLESIAETGAAFSETVELSHVVQEAALLLASRVREKNAKIKGNFHHPPSPTPVRGDREKLYQLVEILITEAARRGAENRDIDIDLQVDEDRRARLAVAFAPGQEGPGNDPPAFSPDPWRLLGRAMAKDLVHLHGGSISESAGVDGKVETIVRFPSVDAEPDMAEAPHVLILGEGDLFRSICAGVLEEQGAKWTAALNVDQARDVLNQQIPDLVLFSMAPRSAPSAALLSQIRGAPALRHAPALLFFETADGSRTAGGLLGSPGFAVSASVQALAERFIARMEEKSMERLLDEDALKPDRVWIVGGESDWAEALRATFAIYGMDAEHYRSPDLLPGSTDAPPGIVALHCDQKSLSSKDFFSGLPKPADNGLPAVLAIVGDGSPDAARAALMNGADDCLHDSVSMRQIVSAACRLYSVIAVPKKPDEKDIGKT